MSKCIDLLVIVINKCLTCSNVTHIPLSTWTVQDLGKDGDGHMQLHVPGIGLDEIHDNYIDFICHKKNGGQVEEEDFKVMTSGDNTCSLVFFCIIEM